jgi:hypothetical protein
MAVCSLWTWCADAIDNLAIYIYKPTATPSPNPQRRPSALETPLGARVHWEVRFLGVQVPQLPARG